jgi:hypothetical protein
MLSEEALIVLAGFGACGLLLLGVLELVWPTRPRHPVRVRRPAPARRSLPVRAGRAYRTSPLERHGLEGGRSPYIRRAPVTLPAEPLPVQAALPVAAVAETPALLPEPAAPLVTAEVARVGSVVDECFALQQAGRYEDVVDLAMVALEGGDETRRPADAHTTAALWSVVALSRQGLGEDVQARDALQAAVGAAPAADRPTYQRQLAALADGIARRLLAEAEQHPRAESEACLESIRAATSWLAHGMAAMPGDAALAELSATAQATLWRAYERAVMVFLQRQEFRAARRLLREALDDPRFPSGRVDAFREMFTGTFSGEIGQLTAQAIRSVQDGREADALRALQRAETLLGTLSDEALSATRREEVDRRLWWVYCKLGERRLEAGEPEAALEPLVHALGYDVGSEPHEETRALLERALDGAADREAAIVHCDRLWARLHGARETLAGDDLAAASEKAPRLFETLGR